MAKKETGSKKTTTQKTRTTRKKAGSKRSIDQYDHSDKQRIKIPLVGLVTREADPLESIPSRRSVRYAACMSQMGTRNA